MITGRDPTRSEGDWGRKTLRIELEIIRIESKVEEVCEERKKNGAQRRLEWKVSLGSIILQWGMTLCRGSDGKLLEDAGFEEEGRSGFPRHHHGFSITHNAQVYCWLPPPLAESVYC